MKFPALQNISVPVKTNKQTKLFSVLLALKFKSHQDSAVWPQSSKAVKDIWF